jgi:hypothetical protein
MVGLRPLWQLHTTAARALLIFYLILGKSKKFSQLTQTKIVFFLSPNFFKKLKLLGDRIFSLAAEFFFWTGRKVLQRVGNTWPQRRAPSGVEQIAFSSHRVHNRTVLRIRFWESFGKYEYRCNDYE